METMGQRIRRLREERRWSQTDLADLLGVSGRTVGNWERGKASPRNSLGAIEKVFGVALEDDAPLGQNDKVVLAIEGSELSRADRAELVAHYWRLLDATAGPEVRGA